MYAYDGLNRKLEEAGIGKTRLAKDLRISSRTIAKIARGEKLSSRVLQKIAAYFQCQPDDLFRKISVRSRNYAYVNSNHIEGSRLTEDQTRMIFETSTIDAGDGIPVDDIVETVHHFRAIDYVIDVAEEELSEEIIKHLHYILKHDTKDAQLSWFAVGEYKKRPNIVGGHETAKPDEVAAQIQHLLKNYAAKSSVTIEDIIAFHAAFEHIHPFQDGNGRVGRLIALKECLRFHIVPFLIEDSKKAFYYRGLANWSQEHGWLVGTCLDGQDTFKRLLTMLGISG